MMVNSLSPITSDMPWLSVATLISILGVQSATVSNSDSHIGDYTLRKQKKVGKNFFVAQMQDS